MCVMNGERGRLGGVKKDLNNPLGIAEYYSYTYF
jgi:hypothetical protein